MRAEVPKRCTLLLPKYDQDGKLKPAKRYAHDFRSLNAGTVDTASPLHDVLRNLHRIRGRVFACADTFAMGSVS